ELARAGRPAERGLGVAHAFARADHPPEDIREPWPRSIDRCMEPPLRVQLSARQIEPRRGPATPVRDRSRVPGHGHARTELGPLPVAAKPLARLVLALVHMTAREKPAERRLSKIDRHRSRGPLSLSRGRLTLDRLLPKQTRRFRPEFSSRFRVEALATEANL